MENIWCNISAFVAGNLENKAEFEVLFARDHSGKSIVGGSADYPPWFFLEETFLYKLGFHF